MAFKGRILKILIDSSIRHTILARLARKFKFRNFEPTSNQPLIPAALELISDKIMKNEPEATTLHDHYYRLAYQIQELDNLNL